jgi:hypothetical protein
MPNDIAPSRVLDRLHEVTKRKRAAGQQAQDAQDARRREMWRESKKRNRAKALQTRTLGQPKRVAEPIPSFDDLFAPAAAPKPLVRKENVTRTELEKLSRDRRAPASARVTALRTIAELDGHIGRLQSQAQDVSDSPLSTMTREQLENELVRLRATATR